MEKIAVVGIGNILLRDDGIGVHIIYELEKDKPDTAVSLVDGGTCIFELLDTFAKHDRIIIVDSLKGGHPPGTIYRLSPEQLGGHMKANSSLHDVQVLDMLKNANLLGYYPDVTIIGIEPQEIFYDLELSDALKIEMPKLLEIVRREIAGKAGEIHA